MGRFLLGFAFGIAACILAGFLVVEGGAIDLRADHPAGGLEKWVGSTLLDRTAARHAADRPAPAPTPESIAAGLAHYRDDCIFCHGAPGVVQSDLGIGLNPHPPSLDREKTQRRSDGELFAIIDHGIRGTGMPAFGRTHDEDELWTLVTFVRHLPRLDERERKALEQAEQKEHVSGRKRM